MRHVARAPLLSVLGLVQGGARALRSFFFGHRPEPDMGVFWRRLGVLAGVGAAGILIFELLSSQAGDDSDLAADGRLASPGELAVDGGPPSDEAAPQPSPDVSTPGTTTVILSAPHGAATPPPGSILLRIATHASGLRAPAHADCTDERWIRDFAVGTTLELLWIGNEHCAGWAAVTDSEGSRYWMRLRHLDDPNLTAWHAPSGGTWSDFLSWLPTHVRQCALSALHPAEALEATVTALDHRPTPPWLQRIFACASAPQVVAANTAAILAQAEDWHLPLSPDAASCLLPFVAEAAAVTPVALESTHYAALDPLSAGMLHCSPSTIPTAIFQALSAPPRPDQIECMTAYSTLLHAVAAPTAPRTAAIAMFDLAAFCAPHYLVDMALISVRDVSIEQPALESANCLRPLAAARSLWTAVSIGQAPDPGDVVAVTACLRNQ